ncbi:hypothetical protein LPN01_00375 [Sphingomonas sp. A2-49]|uniref:hypothetical protein n=1 Tax=Sphingomonas sp. A2-49 TaxID=1391375 RepID=UPI0021D177FE|nr:hypothetical protein [Sphingomonas sp. A2-49]MCU6452527.1 hypothetical protein [Sphingomonas sp. A2-49]
MTGAIAPPAGGDLSFGYRDGVAPMMGMLVAIGVVELAVTHVLLAIWHPWIAILLSLVTLIGLGWIVRAIVAMPHRPVLLNTDRLVMRVGTLRSVEIPLGQIAGLRASWDAAAIKDRSVLNLALLAYPNVVVDLRAPLPGRRGIVAIAHRLDDPAAFAAALERLGARG